MKLVGVGDSWCWGAELVDPVEEPVPIMTLPGGGFERQSKPINIEYRLKNRYINRFQTMIGAEELVDLSEPADSNDAIFRKLVEWLINSGYTSGLDTSDLFISIGWTSPERTEFYYKEKWGEDHWATYGPWSLDEQKNKNIDLHNFFNLFFENFGTPDGFIYKYYQTMWATQCLLEKFNIKYVMHQAFYHYPDRMPLEWKDDVYKQEFLQMDNNQTIKNLWNSINENCFVNKDHPTMSTAHHVMVEKGGLDNVFEVFHPNALGHKIWAEYLYEFCTDKGLLS